MMSAPQVSRLLLVSCAVLLGACAQKAAPLYMWEAFPRQQYETLVRNGGGANAEQLLALEAHAEKARATGAALPPGFRAHLGLVKLSAGDAQGAREAWLAEKAAFPESAPYIDRLLQRLEGPAKSEKPA